MNQREQELYEQALQVLTQRYTPGIEQQEIRSSIEQLDALVSQARKDSRTYTTIITRLQDKRDTAIRIQLQHPHTPREIRRGLEDIIYRVEEVLQKHTNQPLNTTRVLVSLEAQKSASTLSQYAKSVHTFTHVPFGYFSLENHQQETIQALHAHSVPFTVEKLYRLQPRPLATPMRAVPWNLALIHAEQAWEHSTGEGARIGIIDTGCDYTHPEIAERFEDNKGFNFVDNTDNPFDDNKHGTHVAGNIAGNTCGVAPQATLYALKFLDENGAGYEVDFIRAAEWAIDNKLHILNGSFGSAFPSVAERSTCEVLAQKNIVFIAAAGNDGNETYSYPASYDTVMSVAAVDRLAQHAPFSQRNDQVNIAAPGVSVKSCIPHGRYELLSGTSMATPHVAGAAGLVYAQSRDTQYVKELLETTASDKGDHRKYGNGLVMTHKAVGVANLLQRVRRVA